MSSLQTKGAIYLTKTPFQLHNILMSLHVESDSCDRSGVGIFSCKNHLEYLPFLCFVVKPEKFFDTIWRPHFSSGDHENISVAS